jgi:phosphopantothenoylcysteine decarboxylase
MANVLLGVTGSVAAVKTPELVAALDAAGHRVKIVATGPSLYFFNAKPFEKRIILDSDEWPGAQYRRGDPVVHIELRKWADALAIAPLDANTLAKLANGLADNALTCVWRAWDLTRPVVLAPAMNTLMWRHPLTRRHLRSLAELYGIATNVASDEDALLVAINTSNAKLTFASPVEKPLACGDTGVGAMAEVTAIVEHVSGLLSPSGSIKSPT